MGKVIVISKKVEQQQKNRKYLRFAIAIMVAFLYLLILFWVIYGKV
jgi:hypothetical protein